MYDLQLHFLSHYFIQFVSSIILRKFLNIYNFGIPFLALLSMSVEGDAKTAPLFHKLLNNDEFVG